MKRSSEQDQAARINMEIMLLETDAKIVKALGIRNQILSQIAQKKISLDLLRAKSLGHAVLKLEPAICPPPPSKGRCALGLIKTNQTTLRGRRDKDAQGSSV